MRCIRLATLLGALIALSGAANAAPSSCPEKFAGGQAPDIVNQALAPKTRELCYSQFAVLHSGISRTPLYSAERLTAEDIRGAESIPREGKFHAEPRLPKAERAELADYKGSGMDRGHMTPSGDAPTIEAQQETFSLANMVPQDHDNNTKLWAAIETSVRELAKANGELYVVTGPIFLGQQLQRLNGRVLVPTNIFKAVYDPKQQKTAAYLVRNAPGREWSQVSIKQIEDMAGIVVFPGLPTGAADATLTLPPPAFGRR